MSSVSDQSEFTQHPNGGGSVHISAMVHPTAYIGAGSTVGPHSIIGKDVVIGRNTTILDNVIIGSRAMLGSDAHVSESVSIHKMVMICSGAIIYPECAFFEGAVVAHSIDQETEIGPRQIMFTNAYNGQYSPNDYGSTKKDDAS